MAKKKSSLILPLAIGTTLLFAIGKKKIVEAGSAVVDYALSYEQKLFIDQLHPIAQGIFSEFIKQITLSGWNVLIVSGYRTFAEQIILKQQDSRNASAGYSFHNYGMALDINASKGTTYLRKASSRESWESSGIPSIGKKLNLFWGENIPNYPDAVHYDLRNVYNINSLHSLALSQSGGDLQSFKGNRIIV